MHQHRAEILVLGAGLQGSGIALELARRGRDVQLLDQDVAPLCRASLRNEGKVHLGFIYANDASRRTAFLQLEGALRFARTIQRWLPAGGAGLSCSTPFHYLVATDSLLAPAALAEHYEAIERRMRERLADDAELDYLGARPDRLFRWLDAAELAPHFTPERFSAGFATAERAVDTDALAAALRRAVASNPRIRFLPRHQVRDLTRCGGGVRVEGESPDGAWRIESTQVVNCTWERRLALDQRMGLDPPADLLHRLKFRVLARVPESLRGAPSVSMVLGRFGDVVIRPDGMAYLSWYPAGLRGWTHDVEPPQEWEGPCRGDVEPGLAREIERDIVDGISAWYPSLRACSPVHVDAGAIVAMGRSDVDDAASALHDRSRIGVESHGAYHTVEPGKLTSAPMFALEAADRVEAYLGKPVESR